MTAKMIRAVYSGGLLHPQEPLALAEGEEVTLTLLAGESDKGAATLSDLPEQEPQWHESHEDEQARSQQRRAAQKQLQANWDESLGPLPSGSNADPDEDALANRPPDAPHAPPPAH